MEEPVRHHFTIRRISLLAGFVIFEVSSYALKFMKRSIFFLTVTILLSGCKNQSAQISEKLFDCGNVIIPSIVSHVIINVPDYNMDLSEAVDNGRFHHQWFQDLTTYKTHSTDSLTINEPETMGHKFRERSSAESVNAIQILPDRKIAGSADKKGYNS